MLRWLRPTPAPATNGTASALPLAIHEADAPREEYRIARFALLRRLVDVERAQGLELGAFDFPTVPADFGCCEIADVRDPGAQAHDFQVPVETIAPVTYVLERGRPLDAQIAKRFDYVILCHVLEHVPDPVGFLNEIGALLRPGGVMLLAVPDKRRTLDWSRPSTTIDDVLTRHYERAQRPPLAQIMQFARTWNEDLRRVAEETPHQFYEWAVKHYESGRADVHCNVWQDHELFAQLDLLVRGGFLPGLSVCARQPNEGGSNEFYVCLARANG